MSFMIFEWIPTETINTVLYQLPEVEREPPENFNEKFEDYDINSTLLVENMG